MLAAIVLLLQGQVELKPSFQKFDKIASSCKVTTEIKSSNGKESKYTLEIELSAEVERSDAEAVVFDCGVNRLQVTGILDGRKVDYEWRKGGAERGDKIAGLQLEKGWKVTWAGKKGFGLDDQAGRLNDVLPIFNPAAFLGFSTPFPQGPVAVGKGWESKGVKVPYFMGFGITYKATLNHVDKSVAKISAELAYTRPESEVPVDGDVNVKGSGDASLDYDVKTGRPLRGATALKISFSQGGLKKEASQVLEFEVKP